MHDLVERLYRDLAVTQDLGLGMILWMSHFFPGATWSKVLRERSLATLGRMWIDPSGYFCRGPGLPTVKFAFTNYGVSIGLQAIRTWSEREHARQQFFATYRSHDRYDRDAITHVMGCSSCVPGRLLTWNRRLGRCRPGPRPIHLDAALLLLRSQGIPEPSSWVLRGVEPQQPGSWVPRPPAAPESRYHRRRWRPAACGHTGPPRDPGRR